MESQNYPIVFKKSFQKTFEKLSEDEQVLMIKCLENLKSYFKTQQAAAGFGIKKLHHGQQADVYEARISLNLRMIWLQTKQQAIFALLGNHDDVRRFLRHL